MIGRLLLSAAAAVSVACVPEYRPPTMAEPHAVVKFRRTYEQVAGTTLHETVDVSEHRAYSDNSVAAAASSPRTDALLLHPIASQVRIATQFSHQEQHRVHESYQESTPHTETETYSCSSGFGSTQTYRTCTRPVTRYTYQTKYRDVVKTVEVSDGSCEATTAFLPEKDHVYLVQYTYQDRGVCQLSCIEQTPSGDGHFANSECRAAPDPH